MWIALGGLLDKKTRPFAGKLENARIAGDWTNTIKNIHPKAGPYTRYEDLKKSTLYIAVEDAIWIGELEFYKEKLKKELNKKRKNPVHNIKFILKS